MGDSDACMGDFHMELCTAPDNVERRALPACGQMTAQGKPALVPFQPGKAADNTLPDVTHRCTVDA